MTAQPIATRSVPLGPLVALALALVATLVGVRTGFAVQDVDEAVFRQTLRQMRASEGYYPAMRDALIEKENAPPRSVRAIRPPTMFLFLRWFPEGLWRWLVGLVYLAILLAAWRLAIPYGEGAAVAACCLAFVWIVAASSYLYLHAELWGAPFFMAGLLRLRKGDDAGAAALVAGATLVRELFGVGLLIGLVLRRRRAWLAATVTVVAAGALHVALASDVLSPAGREVALGNEGVSLRSVLSTIGPAKGVVAWALGVPMFLLGLAALVHHRRTDHAAALLLPFVVVMVSAAIISTRSYWSITWGPGLACWVPGAFLRFVPRSRLGSSHRVA